MGLLRVVVGTTDLVPLSLGCSYFRSEVVSGNTGKTTSIPDACGK
jgi:hypothetical protein